MDDPLVAPAAAAANPEDAPVVGPVVRSVTSSDFFDGETGTDGLLGVFAGIEKPMTVDVGRALREGPGAGVDVVAGRSSEAHDFLGIAVAAGAVGAVCDGRVVVGSEVFSTSANDAEGSVEGGTGVDTVSGATESGMEGGFVTVPASSACGGPSVVSLTSRPAAETDVCEEAGDPGIVGVSADSVTDDEGTVELVCDDQALAAISSEEGSEGEDFEEITAADASFATSGNDSAESTGVAGREGGGVFRSKAWCTTSGGGRALGEIMILGA